MAKSEFDKYFSELLKDKAVKIKAIHPGTVVTEPWVRLKCQFGCGRYGNSHCCPPDTPTPEQTRKILDSYNRVFLIHIKGEKKAGKNRVKSMAKIYDSVVEIEGDMFKDGYYRAFSMLVGPCSLCKTCSKLKGTSCLFGMKARPSMEACGIDVYQTVRNNGFKIKPLKDKNETRNMFCLLLID